MKTILVLAVPLAFFWMALARIVTLPGFIVGYVFATAALFVVLSSNRKYPHAAEEPEVKLARLPLQALLVLRYIIVLAVDIFLSSLDVAKRIVKPTVDVQPTIYRIPTMDPDNRSVVTALSSHGITITPGTLVVDYEEEDGQTIMIVHTLDKVQWDERSALEGQRRRYQQIVRMLGL
jgi:multisubunit Na+/H+ antiporter MnhE subunit